MVSFAFKNVVLFLMIIIIVHVLLKNAILERDRAQVKHDGHTKSSSDTSSIMTTENMSTATPKNNNRMIINDDDEELQMFRKLKRQKEAEKTLATIHKKSDEDDMLKYVLEGDDGPDDAQDAQDMIMESSMTPSLSASWKAHKIPRASTSSALPSLAGKPLGMNTTLRGDLRPHTNTTRPPNSIPRTPPSSSAAPLASSVMGDGSTDCIIRKYPNESQMNGGRLFAGDAESEAGGGLTGANAFDTNFQTFD